MLAKLVEKFACKLTPIVGLESLDGEGVFGSNCSMIGLEGLKSLGLCLKKVDMGELGIIIKESDDILLEGERGGKGATEIRMDEF